MGWFTKNKNPKRVEKKVLPSRVLMSVVTLPLAGAVPFNETIKSENEFGLDIILGKHTDDLTVIRQKLDHESGGGFYLRASLYNHCLIDFKWVSLKEAQAEFNQNEEQDEREERDGNAEYGSQGSNNLEG